MDVGDKAGAALCVVYALLADEIRNHVSLFALFRIAFVSCILHALVMCRKIIANQC